MAGLLTDSYSEAFPTNVSGIGLFQNVERSFTAAGLSGTSTRFPFNSHHTVEQYETDSVANVEKFYCYPARAEKLLLHARCMREDCSNPQSMQDAWSKIAAIRSLCKLHEARLQQSAAYARCMKQDCSNPQSMQDA